MKKSMYLFLTAALLLFACNQKKPNHETSDPFDVSIEQSRSDSLILVRNQQADVVFYNMFSPVDLDRIIDDKQTYFNSSLINSLNNLTKYSDSYKMALNVGVYGADLSYLWIFEQTQQAISYLSAIQHLTNKLGIPKDFVDFTLLSAENSSNEIDSLKYIARDAYKATDAYLRESERENAAILILLGGWIETLHIVLSLYNEPNPKLASKILTQKYSLTSLITMIHNHQEELEMSEYLLLLKKLNESFSSFESKLKADDIHIDTTKKIIFVKESPSLSINPEDFNQVKEQIANIRKHIIE